MTPPDLPRAFLDTPLTHRAYHGPGRPENSRAAIRAAMDNGFGIEIDVQMSRDGIAMVFHDYDLGRLTSESGPIRMREARDLGQIALTGGNEGIPTLCDVLDLVGGTVPVLIEIKDQDGALGPDIGPLEASVAAAVKGYDGPLAVMSFNPHAMAEMARLAPDVPRGLTTCAFPPDDWPTIPEARRAELRPIPDFDRVGARFISHQASDLEAAPVAALKARGVPVLCWTIRSPAEEAEARKIADNVTFEGY